MEDILEVCCSGDEEYLEDIVDFANMVFSIDDNSGVNFAKLLPKAYTKERCSMLWHHIIKKNGKIRGLIDLYPVIMQLHKSKGIGRRLLQAAYIGTVSVHPNSRDKGYMKKLMKLAEKTSIAQKYDLMILDGNRHRYQHHGFEKAGIKYNFHVGMRNILHCCNSMYEASYMETPVYSFEEIDENSKCPQKLFELYLRRNIIARTKEDFLLCLSSYGASTYMVLKENEIVGYLNVGEERNVLEFEIDNILELPRIIYDFMEGIEVDALNFEVGIDETEKIKCLEKMSDYYNAAMSHQIKILNYINVLEFLFAWKQEYGTPQNGDYIIGIRTKDVYSNMEQINNYLIKLSDNGVNVEITKQNADIVLDDFTFIQMLTTSYCLTECLQKKSDKDIPSGWFPLPFFLPAADTF